MYLAALMIDAGLDDRWASVAFYVLLGGGGLYVLTRQSVLTARQPVTAVPQRAVVAFLVVGGLLLAMGIGLLIVGPARVRVVGFGVALLLWGGGLLWRGIL